MQLSLDIRMPELFVRTPIVTKRKLRFQSITLLRTGLTSWNPRPARGRDFRQPFLLPIGIALPFFWGWAKIHAIESMGSTLLAIVERHLIVARTVCRKGRRRLLEETL
jgi:hypothetical protein